MPPMIEEKTSLSMIVSPELNDMSSLEQRKLKRYIDKNADTSNFDIIEIIEPVESPSHPLIEDDIKETKNDEKIVSEGEKDEPEQIVLYQSEDTQEISLSDSLMVRDFEYYKQAIIRNLRSQMQVISFIDSKIIHIEEIIDRFLHPIKATHLDRVGSFMLFSILHPTLNVVHAGVSQGRFISAPYIESMSASGKYHTRNIFESSLKALGHDNPTKITELLCAHFYKFMKWLGNSDNHPVILFIFFCHFVMIYILFFRDGIFLQKRTRRSLNVSVSKFKQSRYSSSSDMISNVSDTNNQSTTSGHDDPMDGNDTGKSRSLGSPLELFTEHAKLSNSEMKDSFSSKEAKKMNFFHGWDATLHSDERAAAIKFEDPDSLIGWRIRIRPDWTDRKVTGIVVDTYKKVLKRKTIFRVQMDTPHSHKRRPSMSESLEVAVTCGIRGKRHETESISNVDSHLIRNFDLRRVGRGHGVPFVEVVYVGKVVKNITQASEGGGTRTTSYTIDHDAHAVI